MNFPIVLLKNGEKIMILKCIQYIMKGNQLLLKDLLELQEIKSINISLEYRKMCMLIN